MSTFAIPCAHCANAKDHWIHFPGQAGSGDFAHRYQPDESSVEFAAVKLREALQIAMLDSREFLPPGSYRMHSIGNSALVLADAAGIKAEP